MAWNHNGTYLATCSTTGTVIRCGTPHTHLTHVGYTPLALTYVWFRHLLCLPGWSQQRVAQQALFTGGSCVVLDPPREGFRDLVL